jgi:formate dehydrogenase maturation protein FdhE
MASVLARESVITVAMPLDAAAYCADCEAVFDMRRYRACPACGSSTMVPVSSLINKSSLLAQPGR